MLTEFALAWSISARPCRTCDLEWPTQPTSRIEREWEESEEMLTQVTSSVSSDSVNALKAIEMSILDAIVENPGIDVEGLADKFGYDDLFVFDLVTKLRTKGLVGPA